MAKKNIIVFSALFILFLFLVGCVPKGPATTPTEPIGPSEELPETGEASVDSVGEDISNTGEVDEELDTGELESVDDILADIENI